MSQVSAILLAAGESTRMGSPKPLLEWQGTTLVRYQVQSLLEGGAVEVVVVVGHLYADVTSHVEAAGGRWILNPDYLAGKTTSIKAGLRAASTAATGVLLLAVDQPRPPIIVRAVLEAHANSNAAITSPRFEGRGGHPILFSGPLRPELQAITEEKQGIRAVFRAHRGEVNQVPIDDPVVLLDLNTPAEHKAARKKYGA